MCVCSCGHWEYNHEMLQLMHIKTEFAVSMVISSGPTWTLSLVDKKRHYFCHDVDPLAPLYSYYCMGEGYYPSANWMEGTQRDWNAKVECSFNLYLSVKHLEQFYSHTLINSIASTGCVTWRDNHPHCYASTQVFPIEVFRPPLWCLREDGKKNSTICLHHGPWSHPKIM